MTRDILKVLSPLKCLAYSGILLSSRFFYETIIDKADRKLPKKHPQKLVACGVVSIIWGLYYRDSIKSQASGLSVF
jgi:hypothetical protein